jgi:hypothetical protein
VIVALLDEACLKLFRTLDEAEQEIEPLDVAIVRAIFDESGVPYAVRWSVLNREGWFGGRIPGEYHFIPAGPANPKALVALIDEYVGESEFDRDLLLSIRSKLTAAENGDDGPP